mgnify:CR=1 FL=1
MLDINKRVRCEGTTVAEMIEALQRLPQDGIVHFEGKKKGSHTLRHSLASRLLEHEIPLPVISEILGHTTTETTMTYLRIDITELRKCALEVAI